jgi:PAS domain-containing protein
MTNTGRNPLWPGEVDALISACATAQERLVILALLETAMTADELGRLTSGAIVDGDCEVQRSTGASKIRLSADLQALLQDHFRWTAEFGMGKRQIQRIVRSVGKRAGLKPIVTPDILRRTSLWNPFEDHEISSGHGRVLLEAAERACDIILVADDNGKYVDVNQAASDAFRLPKAAIIGQNVGAFFLFADGRPVPLAWSQFMAAGEQSGTCRLRKQEEVVFEYRARANFVPGLHVSILRPNTESTRRTGR